MASLSWGRSRAPAPECSISGNSPYDLAGISRIASLLMSHRARLVWLWRGLWWDAKGDWKRGHELGGSRMKARRGPGCTLICIARREICRTRDIGMGGQGRLWRLARSRGVERDCGGVARGIAVSSQLSASSAIRKIEALEQIAPFQPKILWFPRFMVGQVRAPCPLHDQLWGRC